MSENKKLLFIDTDGVADDCRALSLALQQDDVQIVGISTVTGCVSAHQAVINISRTIRANDKSPNTIPIFQGAVKPIIGNNHHPEEEEPFFGSDGLGGLPEDTPAVTPEDHTAHDPSRHAALAIIDVFRGLKNKVSLVCLGPLTNIALALKLEPEFASWPKEVIIMGGNLYGAGNVRSHSTAEFNFSNDPEAAHIVIDEIRQPITIVPWECAYFAMNTEKVDFHAHLKYDTPLARYFSTITKSVRKALEPTNSQYSYCDEIAVAVALFPDKVVRKERKLRGSVELHGSRTRGQLALDWTESFWSPSFHEIKFCSKRPHIRLVDKYNIAFVDQLMHETVKKQTHV